MEVTLVYQDRQATMTKPDNKYGSNLEAFSQLLTLALEGVGLSLDGTLKEAE